MPIIDGGRCPTRTPKRNLQQSWHFGAVDSKSNFLARPHERLAGSKPSLVIGFGHISCLMIASWRQQSKSSKPTSVPMLGMSLVRLPFCIGIAIKLESSQTFLDSQKLGPQGTTRKNKISLYNHLCRLLEACPQLMLLRNKSKAMIPPCTQFASKQEFPANYNSKIS